MRDSQISVTGSAAPVSALVASATVVMYRRTHVLGGLVWSGCKGGRCFRPWACAAWWCVVCGGVGGCHMWWGGCHSTPWPRTFMVAVACVSVTHVSGPQHRWDWRGVMLQLFCWGWLQELPEVALVLLGVVTRIEG